VKLCACAFTLSETNRKLEEDLITSQSDVEKLRAASHSEKKSIQMQYERVLQLLNKEKLELGEREKGMRLCMYICLSRSYVYVYICVSRYLLSRWYMYVCVCACLSNCFPAYLCVYTSLTIFS